MYKYIDWSTVGILGQYICEQRYPDTCIYTCIYKMMSMVTVYQILSTQFTVYNNLNVNTFPEQSF